VSGAPSQNTWKENGSEGLQEPDFPDPAAQLTNDDCSHEAVASTVHALLKGKATTYISSQARQQFNIEKAVLDGLVGIQEDVRGSLKNMSFPSLLQIVKPWRNWPRQEARPKG
jgi:hypothetical protein